MAVGGQLSIWAAETGDRHSPVVRARPLRLELAGLVGVGEARVQLCPLLGRRAAAEAGSGRALEEERRQFEQPYEQQHEQKKREATATARAHTRWEQQKVPAAPTTKRRYGKCWSWLMLNILPLRYWDFG